MKRFLHFLLTISAVTILTGLLIYGLCVPNFSSFFAQEEHVRAALAQNPDNKNARIDLAAQLTNRKAMVEAAFVLRDGLDRTPDDVDLLRAMSRTYLAWSELTSVPRKTWKAIWFLKRLADVNAITLDEMKTMASLQVQVGVNAQTIAALQDLATKCPADTQVHDLLHDAYLAAGQYEKAVDYYESLAKGPSPTAHAWCQLGIGHYLIGNYKMAQEALNTSIKTAIGNELKQAEQALNLVQRLTSPDNEIAFDAHNSLAWQHYQHHRFDRANDEYKIALSIPIKNEFPTGWCYYMLGNIAIKTNDYHRAETLLLKSIDIFEASDDWALLSHAHEYLATVYSGMITSNPSYEHEYYEKALAETMRCQEVCKRAQFDHMALHALADKLLYSITAVQIRTRLSLASA